MGPAMPSSYRTKHEHRQSSGSDKIGGVLRRADGGARRWRLAAPSNTVVIPGLVPGTHSVKSASVKAARRIFLILMYRGGLERLGMDPWVMPEDDGGGITSEATRRFPGIRTNFIHLPPPSLTLTVPFHWKPGCTPANRGRVGACRAGRGSRTGYALKAGRRRYAT